MQSNPNAPDPAQSYRDGIVTYLTYLPDLLNAEQNARNQFDPQRVQDQQNLQTQFGATQYQQQLDALNQLDPQSGQVRSALGNRVLTDLNAGTSLTPEMDQQLTSQVRGAQAARGNNTSTASSLAEGLYKGNAAQDLYMKRLGAAGSFLSSPTPIQQLTGVQSVTPDRTSAYTNPAAGYAGQNFALQNYQNQLAQGNQSNPWAGALGGAASGAATGASFGPYGALIGGVAGGALGYFSDEALKRDIVPVGTSESGIPIIDFSYKSDPEARRFRGVSAQDIQRIKPEAVSIDPSGYLLVNYNLLDVAFCQL